MGCFGKATNDKFIRKIRHICLYENQIIITWGDSLYFLKNIITKLFRKKYKGCLSKIKKEYLVKEKDLIPEMIIPKK